MQKKSTLGRKVVATVIIVTGLYVVVCLGLTLAQRKLLYYPCKDSTASLTQVANAHGFAIWSNTNGQLVGWKRLNKTPARGQILVLHGNGGCALDRLQYADGLQQIAPVDVYILEYPGYDGRRGSP